ncbi:TPA: hypothetical protein ACPXFP_002214, partial [Streptococcus pneumoniae]
MKEYLQAGLDVDLLGPHQSGRTVLLEQLEAVLERLGHTVLSVRPLGALSEVPNSGLLDALRRHTKRSEMNVPEGVLAALEKLARTNRLTILIDDFAVVDRATWAAITRARQQHHVGLVRAYQEGARFPTELRGDGGGAIASVRIPPFSLHEMRDLLTAELGAPVDAATLNRVFAKSAGLPGLARVLAQVSRVEGSIELVGGEWTATASLWTPTLEQLVRAP